MSRGPGRTQRAVLDAVAAAVDADGTPQWVSVDEVRGRDAGQHLRLSERESIRRAIRTLARTGTVEAAEVRRRGPAGDRFQLAARLPLTREQRIAELESDVQRYRRIARILDSRNYYDHAIALQAEADALRREG